MGESAGIARNGQEGQESMGIGAASSPLTIPSLRGVMGSWTYYLAVVGASDLASRIRPAHDIREAKGLDDFLQRELKDRASKISQYLRGTEARFFNALVVGVFGAVPEWFPLAVTKNDFVALTAEESAAVADTIGLLRLTGREQMFAIDGQHRAEAIRRALAAPDSAQTEPRVESDEFPVLFVAHVDDAAGKRRSRRLFADINKRAVPVSRGDLAVIDEEDLACIVARRVYASKGPMTGLIAITERPETAAGEAKSFTNLLTVVDVCRKLRKLVTLQRRVPAWDPTNVEALLGVVSQFITFLMKNVPQLKACLENGRPSIHTMRETRRHLLFRPIGMILIADAYATCKRRARLTEYATWLGSHDLSLAAPLFRNVIWEHNRVLSKGRGLAARLVEREAGALRPAELQKLLVAYRRHRGDQNAELPDVDA